MGGSWNGWWKSWGWIFKIKVINILMKRKRNWRDKEQKGKKWTMLQNKNKGNGNNSETRNRLKQQNERNETNKKRYKKKLSMQMWRKKKMRILRNALTESSWQKGGWKLILFFVLPFCRSLSNFRFNVKFLVKNDERTNEPPLCWWTIVNNTCFSI